MKLITKTTAFIHRAITKLPPNSRQVYMLNAFRGLVALAGAAAAAHYLGMYEYGKFVTAIAAVGFVQSLVETRNSEAVAVFLSRKSVEPKKVVYLALMLDAFAGFALISGVYAVISFLTIMPFVGDLLNLKFEMMIVSLIGMAQIFRGVFIGLCMHIERIDMLSKINLTEEILKFAAVVLVGHLFPNAKASELAQSYVIVAWFGTGLSILFAFRLLAQIQINANKSSDANFTKDYFRYISKAFFATFLKAFHSRMDILFMSAAFGFSASGVLEIIKRAAFPLSFVMGPLAQLTFKQFVDASRVPANLYAKTKRSMIISFALAGCYFIVALYPIKFAVGRLSPLLSWGFIEISILFASACMATTMWWCRNFSNLTSQNYSILSNFIASLYMLLVASAASQSGSAAIFAFSLLGLNLIIVLYWWFVARFEATRSVREY